MPIIIKYNSNEFKAPVLTGDDNNEEEAVVTPLTTLGELREWISNETGCDLATMKLIWKGKFVVLPMEEPLQKFNFKSTSKIMVMGVSTKDPGLETLFDYEKNHLIKLSGIFKAIEEDLTELEKNFYQGDMLNEMLRRMEKRIMEFTEKSLRHLESIDALEIYEKDTTDEQKKRNREKRKTMVDGIQTLLRDNDKLTLRLEHYRKSLEYL